MLSRALLLALLAPLAGATPVVLRVDRTQLPDAATVRFALTSGSGEERVVDSAATVDLPTGVWAVGVVAADQWMEKRVLDVRAERLDVVLAVRQGGTIVGKI